MPAGKKEKFLLLLVNRPQLILQSEAGFVGRSPGTQRLDGNRPAPDVNTVTLNEDGFYHFRIGEEVWAGGCICLGNGYQDTSVPGSGSTGVSVPRHRVWLPH